jgi:hypothetical protein
MAQRTRSGSYLASGYKTALRVAEYAELAQQGNWEGLYAKIDNSTRDADAHPNAVIWALLILITKYANAKGQSFVPVARKYIDLMRADGSADTAQAIAALREHGIVMPDW